MPRDHGAADATGFADRPHPTATSGEAPSFTRDVVPFLARNCAESEGCHGAKPTDSVDVDLRAPSAYAALVEAEAAARKGAVRVRPGDPARSFLLDKLTGRLRSKEGKRMPVDPLTGAPAEPSAEQRAFIETVLVPWIRAGAPNN